MPGITGIISHDNIDIKINYLNKMLGRLYQENFYRSDKMIDKSLGLYIGWTNFSDTPYSRMPIWNENKDVYLIIIGQIFDSDNNKRWLKNKNHLFDMNNYDYLVHLYEEKGEEFFRCLNGQFAGLLADCKKRVIYLFNDRFGFGRIYYRKLNNEIYFSTEAKTLLELFPDCRDFDYEALADYLVCGCTLNNKCLFKNISILPPASVWKICENGFKDQLKSYGLSFIDDNQRDSLSADQYYDNLKTTLQNTIPNYFPKDIPIGISVTGGKDTRIILSFVDLSKLNITAYTFGSIYRNNRDEKIGKEIARVLNLPFKTIKVGSDFLNSFPALAEKTIYITDGTMDVSGAPDLYCNRIAREIAPIRITGNYGQEILEGAISFKPTHLGENFIIEDLNKLLRQSFERYYSEQKDCSRFSFIIRKQMPWHHYNRYKLESSQLQMHSPFLDKDIITLASKIRIESNPAIESIRIRLYSEANPELSKIETDRGFKANHISKFNKIKTYYQEFLFKSEYAFDYGMPNFLSPFDFLLKPFHPEKLFLGRHKFYHFRIWYRDILKEYVQEILLDEATLSRPYLNRPLVEKIIKSHIKGIQNHTYEIHKLLSIELINRLFFQQR